MNLTKNNRVIVKFFIGFHISVDFKIELNQNKAWKQALLVKNQENNNLTVVRYSESEYIGQYIEYSLLTLKEIKEKGRDIGKHLAQFLPEFSVDLSKITVFPQVFVS